MEASQPAVMQWGIAFMKERYGKTKGKTSFFKNG